MDKPPESPELCLQALGLDESFRNVSETSGIVQKKVMGKQSCGYQRPASKACSAGSIPLVVLAIAPG